MNLLKNIPLTLKFISNVAAVNSENGTYHKYVQKAAAEEISKSYEIGRYDLSRLDFLKIQWYMATTLYLGELLCELRRNKLSRQEKKSLIYLGALMAITDLMVDTFHINQEKLTKLMTDETERQRKDLSAIEQILFLYYRRLLTVTGKEKMKIIHDFSLLKPQIESQEQLSDNLKEEEVMAHTRKKGGTALLLTATLLIDINEKNREAFFQLGAFIQLMNDSQDLPKDLKNGITTFVRFQKSYDDIIDVLDREFNKTSILFARVDFPKKRTCQMLFYFHALMTGIQYKLYRYAQITEDNLDLQKIRDTGKTEFRIKMFSLQSMAYCLPRIMKFNTKSRRQENNSNPI